MIFWTHTGASNRRRGSNGVKIRIAVGAFFLCGLIAGLGVGYVALKQQIFDLGRSIATKEAQLKTLREQNTRLERRLYELSSPSQLHARVMELRLGLQPPQQGQRVRLAEPAGQVEAVAEGSAATMGRNQWQMALRQP
jgi:cell division protein FtsB